MENKLGKIICNLRKEKGITQKDLADALNISDKAISRWECGTGRPTLEMMFQISKYFNISYNDLITARISDDHEDDKIVEEIIKEFSDIGKKNVKRIKFILLFSVIVTIILTIAMIFTNTYNRFKVYKVHLESSEIEPIIGNYIETNIRDTLFIGDIKTKDYIVDEESIISVDLYFIKNNKEYIIQNYSSLKNIYLVGSQSYIEIDDFSDYFDNLYLRITITNQKNEVKEYNAKLNFVLDFSNNKVFYDEYQFEGVTSKSFNYNKTNIEIILLKNGFKHLNDNVITKTDDKYKINYLIDAKVINVYYETNNFYYRYTYHLENEILENHITDNNSSVIQNYKYDIKNNKMDCLTGTCSDHKKVMELLDKIVLYLLK